VLDANGNVFLHKEIIVTNVQPNYVRIRRMCGGSDSGCTPTSYYYCPNGCYEVTAVGDESSSSAPPVTASAPVGAAPASDGALPGPPTQSPLNATTVPATPGKL